VPPAGFEPARADEQAATLASRAAAHASLDNPAGVARLLSRMQKVGASAQVTTPLDRDPAAHTSLEDPSGVANLLDALREAGASGQVTTLASRAAAHTSLNNPVAVVNLLFALQRAGTRAWVSEVIERLPAVGMFRLLVVQEPLFNELKQEAFGEKFPFGREADGRPAGRWDWTDLD
jgi:hypothetical protein